MEECNLYNYYCLENFLKINNKNHFILNECFHKMILNLGLECIKIEVLQYPSFGLVSKKDSGCHLDMDINTFIFSHRTFKFYFQDIFNLFKQNNNLDFISLRKLGQKQEKRMFQATNQVNTHKGLIFVFGIIYYITLYGLYNKISFSYWHNLIKKFTRPLINDFKTLKLKTKGYEIFKTSKFNILGARGEALSGYSIIFHKGLPFLKYYCQKYPYLDYEQQCLLLLVFYLTKINDTTLIFKIGFKKHQIVQKIAKKWLKILSLRGWNAFYKKVISYNELYKKNKISPGGCADLCVVTLFLFYFYKKK